MRKNFFTNSLFSLLCGLCFAFSGYFPVHSQSGNHNPDFERADLRVMFYNVENLFDTINEPGKNDTEFLPQGSRFWTPYRYRQKLISLFKVIAAAGQWEAPEVIGMCEVENRHVLEALRDETPLRNTPYGIIHRNSPDSRGIDVALMYRRDKITVIDSAFFTLHFPHDPQVRTREILYVKALVFTDTLHFFVNHWPSRLGGAQSERNRVFIGSFLRGKVDSLFMADPNAAILIMGDFNDEPVDRSLAEGLGALTIPGTERNQLYNLMAPVRQSSNFGTHKYLGLWTMLDQFIVSGSLLRKNGGIYTRPGAARIMLEDFLLVEDETYSGVRPFRTYDGFRYAGGFSDHLPVVLDLWDSR
jgi:hypothetical protein